MDGAFFADGLKFSCTRCSRCCRHEPGFVFLSSRDLELLARGLGVDGGEVVRLYCRDVPVDGRLRLCLTEKPNLDCVFWENGGCAVYSWRPLQCRSYPFWQSNLSSRERWESLRADCPGVDAGEMHGREEIEEWIRRREREPLVVRSQNGA
ncbi:MAG: YkgJ family cysteine cluster protein [Spirochaetales bacterium]|jgi:Fe-S-cluster containining protein|nr:YkgJ family cysteine cluster protein [Spirochaetales bacterium]